MLSWLISAKTVLEINSLGVSMEYKIGDWVKVIKQDWNEIEIGAVLQIVDISDEPAFIYYQLSFRDDIFPYSEDEITLATELDKALA